MLNKDIQLSGIQLLRYTKA